MVWGLLSHVKIPIHVVYRGGTRYRHIPLHILWTFPNIESYMRWNVFQAYIPDSNVNLGLPPYRK